MRIALIGARGQLGTALQSTLTGDVVPLGRSEIDIADSDRVASCLSEVQPGLVINAAAYNFVDRAEEEPEQAFAVNAFGPLHLARFCGGREIPLVHVSTDYVFSGIVSPKSTGCDPWALRALNRAMPYREFDAPEPISAYGISKLAGERFVRCYCPKHFLVRTCGLYGPAENASKGNFVKTMLRLAGERDELNVVNDQRCTPTSARDLAEWIAALIETTSYGLYHAVNSGDASWFEFAREIFRVAGVEVSLKPITTAEFAAASARPAYSVLATDKLERTLGLTARSWQDAVAEYVAEASDG